MFRKIYELVTLQREHGLSPQRALTLERLVLSSKTATRLYVQYIREEASLRWWAHGSGGFRYPDLDDQSGGNDPLADANIMPAITAQPDVSEEISTPPVIRPRQVMRNIWTLGGWRLGIAAVVIIGLTVGLVMFVQSRNSGSAVLADAINPTWDAPYGTPQIGKSLPASELQLTSGLARIRFPTGAEIIVEAPARLKVEAANGASLLSGKLTAVVPPAAHGFVVKCPDATVVDLGTEFGVNIHSNGLTDVDVFKGSISLAAESTSSPGENGGAGPSVTLYAGSARRVSADRVISPIASNAQAYIRRDDFDHLRATPIPASFDRWRAYSDHLRSNPDLVAYYSFERSSGAPDRLLNQSSAGSSLDGILGGGDAIAIPDWSIGRWPGKGALTFLSGSNEHVSLPDVPALDFSAGRRDSRPFTICVWIRPVTAGPAIGGIICRGWEFHEQYAIDFPPEGGPLRAWIRDQSQPVRNAPIVTAEIANLGSWHLVTSVYDPQSAKFGLFLDGQLVNQVTATRRLLSVPGPVYIGSRKDKSDRLDSTFTGSIDEIAIFKKPLSASEILEMYSAGKPE